MLWIIVMFLSAVWTLIHSLLEFTLIIIMGDTQMSCYGGDVDFGG